MSSTLWKCKAVKKWNIVPMGAEVEIIVTGRTGHPSVDQIRTALEQKYGLKVGSGMPPTTFEYIKKG